jgi:hypothetical protein
MVYNNRGVVVASSALSEVREFYVVSSAHIFSVTDANTYDVTTGALVWSGGIHSGAALAGAFVVSIDGTGIFLTTY